MMLQIESPQRLQKQHGAAEPHVLGTPQRSTVVDESDMILQRRLSTAPVIPGSPSTPTRSTFPFKPAAVTPQGQRTDCPFRPRPVVPALTPPSRRSQKMYSSLPQRRCKSFPTHHDSPPQAMVLEAPAWMTDFSEKRFRVPTIQSLSLDNVSDDIPSFPVPISNDDNSEEKTEEYWWLDDMTNWGPVREKPSTTVRNFLMELRSETIDNKASTHSLVDDADRSSELDDALRDLSKRNETPRESPVMSSLQQQVIEIKRYLTSAHHIHEDKREKIHTVLQKIESVIIGTVKRSADTGQDKSKNTSSMEDYYRKTKVGLTGGSIVTAGLVLIPAPVIPGILVVYGGLMVLASEFDSAKAAVETMQVPMKQLLKDEEDPNKGVYDCFHVIMWEEMIGYAPETKKELDEDFEMIMRMKPWKENGDVSDDAEIERVRREKKNAMKRYARQLLMLEDPSDIEEKEAENTDHIISNKTVASLVEKRCDLQDVSTCVIINE